jgi:hypothetical protein
MSKGQNLRKTANSQSMVEESTGEESSLVYGKKNTNRESRGGATQEASFDSTERATRSKTGGKLTNTPL